MLSPRSDDVRGIRPRPWPGLGNAAVLAVSFLHFHSCISEEAGVFEETWQSAFALQPHRPPLLDYLHFHLVLFIHMHLPWLALSFDGSDLHDNQARLP